MGDWGDFFGGFRQRETGEEAMDLPDSDVDRLFRTLDQFGGVNRLFSRVRGLLRGTVLADMHRGRAFHLVDLGAGACDIPLWLLEEAGRRGLDLRITAVDADPRVVRYARERVGERAGLRVVEGDALDLEALGGFDYVFANHFLHHLADEEVLQVLRESVRLAERGVVFSDLARSPWSYLGFWLVARGYRGSFTREDGLLSIRKGFRRGDFDREALPPGLRVRRRVPGRIQFVRMG